MNIEQSHGTIIFMKEKLTINHIIIKKSPIHGYGVFAGKIILSGEIIEECCILFAPKEAEVFYNYFFAFNAETKALPLGYGAIYNHANQPNAGYVFHEKENIMVITAIKNIQMNEEIFIAYGKEWFDTRQMLIIEVPLWKKYWRPVFDVLLRVVIVLVGLYGFIYALR